MRNKNKRMERKENELIKMICECFLFFFNAVSSVRSGCLKSMRAPWINDWIQCKATWKMNVFSAWITVQIYIVFFGSSKNTCFLCFWEFFWFLCFIYFFLLFAFFLPSLFRHQLANWTNAFIHLHTHAHILRWSDHIKETK